MAIFIQSLMWFGKMPFTRYADQFLDLVAMLSAQNGRENESSPLDFPLPSSSRLSMEEDYLASPQMSPSSALSSPPMRPSSSELPASVALPLTRSRSSTPQTATPLRAGPSISVDDDNASIRSFVPTVSAGDDLEAMLSEMLGSEARWPVELDDDVDIWEGQSEDESEEDLDLEEEPEDDGIFPLIVSGFLMVEDKMILWRSRRKHFFVLSSAGKPIYSRYGDDSVISGYMGVIQTIISFFEDNGDTLRQEPCNA